ncbi:hypothetical protein PF011_g20946 [Phytophthora fragariae]|uniref:Uncharacterized protein n=1 Tax=Phytophthora fragariae TaxID=53985 RepID=A0A6A3IQF8_9STRA|nr:hypothetical protein PF011_g20946 [Phytophthora fragariae]
MPPGCRPASLPDLARRRQAQRDQQQPQAQLAAAAAAAVPRTATATTGREHGDDGIEQAGYGTSAVARPEAAVAPPPTEAICQQVSSADYGQRRSKRQPRRRRKHRVSVANETRGDVVSWSRYRPW